MRDSTAIKDLEVCIEGLKKLFKTSQQDNKLIEESQQINRKDMDSMKALLQQMLIKMNSMGESSSTTPPNETIGDFTLVPSVHKFHFAMAMIILNGMPKLSNSLILR